MRVILFISVCLYFTSCDGLSDKFSNDDKNLKKWIIENELELNSACDTVINKYHQETKVDSNWTSSSIVTRRFAPNLLGTLANLAGDSVDCIVIELTFYKSPDRKKSIFISAEDSSCLSKLKNINLKTDSTQHFIFGINSEPLY